MSKKTDWHDFSWKLAKRRLELKEQLPGFHINLSLEAGEYSCRYAVMIRPTNTQTFYHAENENLEKAIQAAVDKYLEAAGPIIINIKRQGMRMPASPKPAPRKVLAIVGKPQQPTLPLLKGGAA